MSTRTPPSTHAQTAARLRCLAALLVLATTAIAGAATARPSAVFRVEPARPIVGQLFRLVLEVETDENAARPRTPELPAVDGLQVSGPPMRGTSSRAVVVNGIRDASVTTRFSWEVVAARAGRFEVPGPRVDLDGDELVPRRVVFEVEEGPDATLFEVRVVADRERLVLGEPLELRLEVDVVPYEQADIEYVMPPRDAWGLIDWNGSSLGPFRGELEDLVRSRRLPTSQIVVVDGERRYRFAVEATVRPQRTGPLVLEPVSLLLRYPREVLLRRDFFGQPELRLGSTLLLQAAARVPEVEVVDPPTAGRPPWWSGAVGRFAVMAATDVRRASVGDPIPLRFTVFDRTEAGVDLTLLAAPRLAEVPELAGAFGVPEGTIAGTVDGRGKTFEFVIRPLRADLDEIPSIPFSWWDPERGEWGTARTPPLPLEVEAVETLSLDEIVGGRASRAPATPDEPVAGPADAADLAGGLRPNRGTPGDGAIADRRSDPRPGPALIVGVLGLPPACFAAFLVATTVRRSPVAAAAAAARRRLREAGPAPDPGEIAAALRAVAATAGGLDPQAASSREVLRALPRHAGDPTLEDDLRRVLDAGDAARYGNATAAHTTDRAAARSLVDRVVAAARRRDEAGEELSP